jgi:hypothetical protein
MTPGFPETPLENNYNGTTFGTSTTWLFTRFRSPPQWHHSCSLTSFGSSLVSHAIGHCGDIVVSLRCLLKIKEATKTRKKVL